MNSNAEAGAPIARYRKEFRGGLLALGLPLAAIGAWAAVAPRSWYDNFPGAGRHWVTAFGPFDEHLVTDFGSAELALGALLVFAAVVLERRLVQGALGALLVFSVPHLAYHLTQLDALSTGDNIASVTVLALPVLLAGVLLLMTREPRPAARGTGRIEGSVGYGTR
jgi:hypothetical protein